MPNSILVRDHVTAAPYYLELGVSLAHAASCLDRWGLAMAPVVHEDSVCGLLSRRDVTLATALGASAHDVLVRDVPLHNVHLTSPEASLRQVARAMLLQDASWSVVRDGVQVVGLLSWASVLSALAGSSAETDALPADLAPRTVRNLILADHGNIRHLLSRAECAAARVAATPRPSASDLTAAFEAGRALCATMVEHLAREERFLTPMLEGIDAWGPVRADRLRAEHREQAITLRSYALALEQMMSSGQGGPVLGALVQQLVESLRNDMRNEEEGLLRSDLLQDDPTATVVEAG